MRLNLFDTRMAIALLALHIPLAACKTTPSSESQLQSEDNLPGFIQARYEECLVRGASPKEVSDWTATGKSREELSLEICESPEAAFVSEVRWSYRRCLERSASSNEVRDWKDAAVRDRAGIARVVKSICESKEAAEVAARRPQGPLESRVAEIRAPSAGCAQVADGFGGFSCASSGEGSAGSRCAKESGGEGSCTSVTGLNGLGSCKCR